MRTWKSREGAANVRQVIAVVILTVIALLMLPLVQNAVNDAKNVTDSTGDTLLNMVPIFYVLGVVLAAVLWVIAETKKL